MIAFYLPKPLKYFLIIILFVSYNICDNHAQILIDNGPVNVLEAQWNDNHSSNVETDQLARPVSIDNEVAKARSNNPLIKSIFPVLTENTGKEIITIVGENLGSKLDYAIYLNNTNRENRLSGFTDNSNILNWTKDTISFKLNRAFGTGPIYIYDKKSKEIIYQSDQEIKISYNLKTNNNRVKRLINDNDLCGYDFYLDIEIVGKGFQMTCKWQ